MQSLEAALRYNPTSSELKASLAEVYIRMGRFDEATLELCRQALEEQVDNVLLRQAGEIGRLIEFTRELIAGERPTPTDEELDALLEQLDDFLARSSECTEGWLAWTVLQLLRGGIDAAADGVCVLKRLGCTCVVEKVAPAIERLLNRGRLNQLGAEGLAEFCRQLMPETERLALLERHFDLGQTALGPVLLALYLERFPLERPEEMPEDSRNRFFNLLLDHGDPALSQRWIRRVALMGWEVGSYIVDHSRELIENEQLDEALLALKQLSVDSHVHELIDRIAVRLEEQGDYERAAEVLGYLNENALLERDAQNRHEKEMAREAEISMAELQIRNGRYVEALKKYVSALSYHVVADPAILERIEELLERAQLEDPDPLIRLGLYFRRQQDHPKAIDFLQRALAIRPESEECVLELEGLLVEILKKNPDLPHLRLDLGELYLRKGRLDAAIEELRLAAAAPAVAERAGRALAEALLAADRPLEAVDRYRSLSIQETDFENLLRLAEVLIERKANREGLLALGMIARLAPDWRDVGDRIRQMEEVLVRPTIEVTGDLKMRELIGDMAVGRYQYIDKLGSGGMGVVYKVFDLRNQRTVAMKILREALTSSSKALDRFFREARIAATLSHNNIVNIYDFNISNAAGQSFIVMEYVDGPALREVIDRQFRDGIDISMDYITEILSYMIQVCDALGASHARGIIHRDIKPDNIMTNLQGEVKITDFGIVHIEEATLTPTGAMLGTPRYMSPEQVTGSKIDARLDLYAVGIVLYESLIGSPPFLTGDISYQQVHKQPVAPRDINPRIPQPLNDLVMRCLAKKPEDRHPSAEVLRGELSRQLSDLGGCAKFGHNTDRTEMIMPSEAGP